MQTNSQHEQQTYGGQSFEPYDFDPRAQEPEAAEGDYTFNIKNAKHRQKAPEKGGYHQLALTLKITATSTDTDEAQKSIGGTIFTDITFYPKGERARVSNMNKRNYLNLLEQCGIDPDIMTRIEGAESFAELVEVLKGRDVAGSVRLSNADNGRTFVNVNFASEAVEAVEETEEAPPARAATRSASRPAAKTAAKLAPKGAAKRR